MEKLYLIPTEQLLTSQDGMVFLVDRKKELIKVKGFQVIQFCRPLITTDEYQGCPCWVGEPYQSTWWSDRCGRYWSCGRQKRRGTQGICCQGKGRADWRGCQGDLRLWLTESKISVVEMWIRVCRIFWTFPQAVPYDLSLRATLPERSQHTSIWPVASSSSLRFPSRQLARSSGKISRPLMSRITLELEWLWRILTLIYLLTLFYCQNVFMNEVKTCNHVQNAIMYIKSHLTHSTVQI